MSLDKQAITKIARLAAIELSESEKDQFAADLSGILKWVEQLGEVDTDGVPQMVSVADIRLPWREDAVTDGGKQEAVIKNAPNSDYGCFVVPKVIE